MWFIGLVFGIVTKAIYVGADQSPCVFNPLCRCSQAGPDLGEVQCLNVPLGGILPVFNESKIFKLKLWANTMRNLNEKGLVNTGLWRLEIGQNDLTDIPPAAFDGLERSLWELSLAENRLQEVPRDAIKQLKKLRLLDLSSNKITDIFRRDFASIGNTLETLILCDNGLRIIQQDSFKELNVLRTLDLQRNNIHSIHTLAFSKGLQQLTHLDMSDNFLTRIPFQALSELPHISHLILSHNQIKEPFDVMFQGQLNLQLLDLEYNEITELAPFAMQNFNQLEVIKLAGNPILRLGNESFMEAKIEKIYLDDVKLREIDHEAFKGVEQTLEHLSLDNNKLEWFPNASLAGCNKLTGLSIRNNQLKPFGPGSFGDYSYIIKELRLDGARMPTVALSQMSPMRNLKRLGLMISPEKETKGGTLDATVFQDLGYGIEHLILRDNNLLEINRDGFKHLTGLKYLDLSSNNIIKLHPESFVSIGHTLEKLDMEESLKTTRLPPEAFSYLTYLKFLNLEENHLEDIPPSTFNFMRNLRILNLRNNRLDMVKSQLVSYRNNPSLQVIDLSFNRISQVENGAFSNLDSLIKIILNENKLSKLTSGSFKNLKDIKYIYLSGNSIGLLEKEVFQSLPNIEKIDLSHNKIAILNLDAFEQIGNLATLTVRLDHNQISQLLLPSTPWSSYSNIKNMTLSHNNITYIEPGFFSSICHSLIQLDLSNNKITNITVDTFKQFKYLRVLYLEHNSITEIEYESFIDMENLQIISLGNNNLEDLPPEFLITQKNLNYLDLSHNDIESLPKQFVESKFLHTIILSHNNLRVFPAENLKESKSSIRHLDLSHNQIENLQSKDLEHFAKLSHLDLSGNRIAKLAGEAFTPATSIHNLDLSFNTFESNFDFKVLTPLQKTLRRLSLSGIALNQVSLEGFSNLLALNLSHNNFTSIPLKSLGNLSDIRILDMSHNFLKSVTTGLWHTMIKLGELYLNDNPIASLGNDTFVGLESLEHLDITNLPLTMFQTGSLSPMFSLRSLKSDSCKRIDNFRLSDMLLNNNALRSLNIRIDSKEITQLFHGRLPSKLHDLTLTGPQLQKIQPDAFKDLQDNHLRLKLSGLSLTQFPEEIFRSMDNLKYLSLVVENNINLTTIGSPVSDPTSVTLLNVDFQNNGWKCDCGIGWVEKWLHDWMKNLCNPEEKVFDENENCLSLLHNLRNAKCLNYKKRSVLDVLHKDIECMSGCSSLTMTIAVAGLTILNIFL